MRLAVLTDASCDLPESFLRHHSIEILPSTMRIEDRLVLDERDPIISSRLYRKAFDASGADRDVQPATLDQTWQRIVDRLMPRYDYVLCIAPDAALGPVHRNLTRAAFAALNDSASMRREGTARSPFGMRVIDSRATSAALGLIVARTCELIAEGDAPDDVANAIEAMRDEVASFLVPPDATHLDAPRRWRDHLARALGQRPILHRQGARYAVTGRAAGCRAAIEKLLLLATAEIRRGLAAPQLVISHGGDLAQIAALPGYEQLSLAALEHKVTLLPAMMSVSRALVIGSGCTEVAYVPRTATR